MSVANRRQTSLIIGQGSLRIQYRFHEASLCPSRRIAGESAIRPVFNRMRCFSGGPQIKDFSLPAAHGGALTENVEDVTFEWALELRVCRILFIIFFHFQ
jgi:hypothetical protein